MTTLEKWKSPTLGPWPLFAKAGATRAAHTSGPEGTCTWTAQDGQPLPLPSLCPHRGMPLGGCTVAQGQAVCPYHGLKLPPLQNRAMFRCKDMDWMGAKNAAVAFLEQQAQEPWLKEVFRLEGQSTAPLRLCLENFLDATHTPHVHPMIVRQAGHEHWIQAHGVAHPWGFEIAYDEDGQQSGLIGRLTEPPRLVSYGRYLHPFAAQVDYVGLDGKSYFRATAFMRPDDAGTKVLTIVESSLWRMGLGPLRPVSLLTKALFSKVLQQDIQVLDQTWAAIKQQGWGPEDLLVRAQDLAWPWLERWQNGSPPLPGETFAGRVLA